MNKEKIIPLLIIFLILILLIIIYKHKNNDDNYDTQIYFFNAGKADAIIIQKNKQYMMIDTAEESLNEEILTYFKNNNINKLDYLIITHFDKDHVGSASYIIDNIKVDNVLQSNYPKDSEVYNNYLEALNNKNITPITITNDYNISLDTLDITVNGPNKIYDSNESNNSSLIVSVKDNNNKFLFMGDAQNARIKDFIGLNNEEYDFIKIPYHGNYLKRLYDLLENKNIKYAVITSSNEELEDSETISMLNKYNIKYYLTRKGSIRILSNGSDIKIKQ